MDRRTIGLSLFGFIFVIGAIWSNDTYLASVRPQYIVADNTPIEKLNRAIANVQPTELLQGSQEAILADHAVAARLAEQERKPTALSQSVSEVDQLRFGLLKGKYSLRLNDSGRVSDIEYADTEAAGEMPENLNPEIILNKYKDILAVKYTDFKPVSEDKNQNAQSKQFKFDLISEKGQAKGSAIFEMNDEGRLIKARISAN